MLAASSGYLNFYSLTGPKTLTTLSAVTAFQNAMHVNWLVSRYQPGTIKELYMQLSFFLYQALHMNTFITLKRLGFQCQ